LDRFNLEIENLEEAMVRAQGLNHIHLIVRDMDRSLRFYRDALGLEERFRKGDRMVFLNPPGSDDLVTLNESAEEAGLAGTSGGVSHFGFRLAESADLDQVLAEVAAAGGALIGQGEHAPGVRFAFVRDPDGYVIEL
jgi:catechol 2,3-dioxygenase